jgi:prophage tail gpP-like protein
VALETFEVVFGGAVYDAWKAVRLTRQLDAISGAFDVSAGSPPLWPARPDDEAEIRIGGEPVFRGHVEDLEAEWEEATLLRLGGRERTADLADCSAEEFELSNAPPRTIVEKLLEPFELPLQWLAEDGTSNLPVPIFRVQPSETAWSAIERVSRLRGVLVYSNGLGGVVVARVGAVDAAGSIEEGDRLKKATVSYSNVDRFSTYTVRGQRAGTDDDWGGTVAQAEGRAFDGNVGRHRPLELVAEGSVSDAIAQQRAEWEAIVRAARAFRVVVTLKGWRQTEGGPLWAPNLLVPVSIPSIRISGRFLVNRVDFTSDEDAGTMAVLELVSPRAYKPVPLVDPEEEFDEATEEEGAEDA